MSDEPSPMVIRQDPGIYEDEYTRRGRRRRARLDADWERRNLAASIARLERELEIGEPCCDGLCEHHIEMVDIREAT